MLELQATSLALGAFVAGFVLGGAVAAALLWPRRAAPAPVRSTGRPGRPIAREFSEDEPLGEPAPHPWPPARALPRVDARPNVAGYRRPA